MTTRDFRAICAFVAWSSANIQTRRRTEDHFDIRRSFSRLQGLRHLAQLGSGQSCVGGEASPGLIGPAQPRHNAGQSLREAL